MPTLDLTRSHLLATDLRTLRLALSSLNEKDPVLKRVTHGLYSALATPHKTDPQALTLALDSARYILESYGKEALPLMQLLHRVQEELEHLAVSQRLLKQERFAELYRAVDQFSILTRIG